MLRGELWPEVELPEQWVFRGMNEPSGSSETLSHLIAKIAYDMVAAT